MLLQDAPDRVHAHLEPLPPQLVADLTGPQTGHGLPLFQDTLVPNRRLVLVTTHQRALHRLTLRILTNPALPVVNGEPSDAEFAGGRAHAVLGRVLERLGPLGRGIDLGDPLFLAGRGSTDVAADSATGCGTTGASTVAGAGVALRRTSDCQRVTVPAGMSNSRAAAVGPICPDLTNARCAFRGRITPQVHYPGHASTSTRPPPGYPEVSVDSTVRS